MFHRTLAACVACLLALATQISLAAGRGVFVNGVQLSAATVNALQVAYRTPVVDGWYWYDPYSGLWGREGGPAAGQLHAGLRLGGPLRENASRGNTNVIVNGRRLPVVELLYLQSMVGPVQPGRYWLDAAGNAGFEGGPALVNLGAASGRGGGGGGYGGGNGGGYNRNTPGGNWGSDGECSYYNSPSGASVMTGNC